MIIEIRKVGFINKGAELMLLAILDKLRLKYPNAKFVMQPNHDDYINRAKLGLYQKVHFRRYNIRWDRLFYIIPSSIRKKFGMVMDDEVDIVLDATGFGYSDQWGTEYTNKTSFDIQMWKKNGTKVIFMPQAFGPFNLKNIAIYFKTIVNQADLICVRDEMSYEYINNLVGDRENIKKFPDFTNLLTGVLPKDFSSEENKICIVPNVRMQDMTSEKESNEYANFMAKCVKILYEADCKPFFLIHEGKKDLLLANEIIKIAEVEVNIILETDALKIKGIIGSCDAMLGSRFHGLVNALSQGVPAIAIGWSHKYQMLLKDYSFEDGILNVTDDEEKINKVLLNLIDVEKRELIASTLKTKSIIQKEKVEQMWDEVYAIVDTVNNG
ncbi:MAG: polysaccharide pyruvyl transferase family protein [Campylobacterota bacterium]|nr:polysaccharide pyruvyl transferase family protein [Campylobacterota bacterium]